MTDKTLDQRFAEAMGSLLGPDFPKHIAVAVSGGGDSMAMLTLAQAWTRVWGVQLWVVTVDHGLRDESAAEAEMVAQEAKTLNLPHATLRWHWDGKGNVQNEARRARLALIDRWRQGIEHVLMAHTSDDVAETFLIRLARGSGVEGLSAMRTKRRVVPHTNAGRQLLSEQDVTQTQPPPLPVRRVAGVAAFSQGYDVIRPCLDMTRAELRHHARTLHIPWVDDPSNDDQKYDRVRARKFLADLAPLNIDAKTLQATAQRLGRASQALQARAASVADDLCKLDLPGVVGFDRHKFSQIERDTQLRLLAAACMWVGGAEYRPRSDALEALLDRLLGGGAGTLIGTKAETNADHIQVFREFSAVASLVVPVVSGGTHWDGRWRLAVPENPAQEIRALGECVKDCPDWRDSGQSRAALMASPAVFFGETLIAAPIAGYNPHLSAQIVTSFTTYLLSH